MKKTENTHILEVNNHNIVRCLNQVCFNLFHLTVFGVHNSQDDKTNYSIFCENKLTNKEKEKLIVFCEGVKAAYNFIN